MRIISGKYKGKKLDGYTLDGTRPTSDRVKESVFAIIQKEIKGSNCLDLFAGSGSLGLEAISNGASSCVFVDYNSKVIETLKKNTQSIFEKEKITFYQKSYLEALDVLEKEQRKFDLVFLDPPYDMHVITEILKGLITKKLLNDKAIIVCEYDLENIDYSLYTKRSERVYGKRKVLVLHYSLND